jgi:Carboxypeptidase regulatory-like domain
MRIPIMTTRQVLALGLSVAMTVAAVPVSVTAAQQSQNTASVSGTAQDEAHKPFPQYSVDARNTQSGQVAQTVPLDANGRFSISALPPANYLVELLNPQGKVVCTEGPFDMTSQLVKSNVNINCRKVAAWWLLGAAAAAGITGAVLAGGPASPSQ